MSNENVTDQPTERPWPASDTDQGWWAGSPPSASPAAAQVPAEPAAGTPAPPADDGPVARFGAIPERTPGDAETFPLWPTTTTVTVAEEPAAEPAPAPALAPAPEPAMEPALAPAAGGPPYFIDPQAHEAGVTAGREQLAGPAEPWPPAAMRHLRQPRDATLTAPQTGRRARPTRRPRHPAIGLPAMLALALLAGFFAWTSAEPFWLDVGHGTSGTARVTSCAGSGVLRRCLATFTAVGAEPVDRVPLVGVEERPGTSVAALMVPGGRMAYAGSPSGLRVRWIVGLGLVLLCGVGLGWATGAGRLGRLRTGLAAWLITLAAPLVLAAGIVLAAY